MKVYGFDDTDVVRGELRAATADSSDLHFREQLMHSLGWEFLSTRFDEARFALIGRMSDEGSDPELIKAVCGFKASYIPIEN